MSAPLKVCVDARLVSGGGGIEQFIIGLAAGLSSLTDGEERYLFLTWADTEEWLAPYLRNSCQVLRGPNAPRPPAGKEWLKRRVPLVGWAWHRFSPLLGRRAVHLERSDGTVERAGCDLMHFTMPHGFLTDVPSIYHPHDLQHLHLPQFFTLRQRVVREVIYRAFCAQARLVVLPSFWSARDVVRHYGLPEAKVRAVIGAPVLTAYPVPTEADLAAARRKLSLPEAFVFYPAHTWPHKNHLGLLEALATLRRRRGVALPLVCSGHRNDFYPRIERRVHALGLAGQVRFLGFVSPLELQCLYRLCRCLVFPTRFEGWGMPLWEAFLSGVPAAVSRVCCLPEHAGDAALLFDPERPEEIAEALWRLWADAELRRELSERGRRQVARFSWERTARLFRAHYRRLAGRPLSNEDRALLAAPPLL